MSAYKFRRMIKKRERRKSIQEIQNRDSYISECKQKLKGIHIHTYDSMRFFWDLHKFDCGFTYTLHIFMTVCCALMSECVRATRGKTI